MACIASGISTGITSALFTGQGRSEDPAGDLTGETAEAPGAYGTNYAPADGAVFAVCDGGAKATTHGLPATLPTNPLGSSK